MIAKLRRKFIVTAMVSVIAVLAVLMGVVNAANYRRVDDGADDLLMLLAENDGVYPFAFAPTGAAGSGTQTPPVKPDSTQPAEQPTAKPDGTQATDTDAQPADNKAGASASPETKGGMERRHGFTAETPYETRYFSVVLDAEGGEVATDTGKIAAVSADEALELAQSLRSKGRTGGYTGSYKFTTVDTDGGTRYIFLDCTRGLSAANAFLVNSLLVSLGGALAVLGLVVLLSGSAVRPVAESYEKQKQFVTNASHEIKTPLTVIDSCVTVLELEQGENKWTAGIRAQVKRLTGLTGSLVSLARMDEGAALPMADFSLTEAVDDALEPFRLLAEQRGLRLASDLEPDVRVRGNEQTLRQLVSLLADNAVKYAAPESQIRFALSRRGKRAVLSCDNAAEGMAAGDQSILFDRFYRGDASHSATTAGSGVGLSVAQSIVQLHGGRITAKSDGERLTVTAEL
jgi:two-component system sensor histidine kinase CiaH